MVELEERLRMPLILHVRHGLRPLTPFMRMRRAMAGISPNSRIKYARRMKYERAEASQALMPFASSENSSTSGHKNESTSQGLFGPGIVPRSKRCGFRKRSSGARL